MQASERFEAICRAMMRPAFYPHLVSCLERRDTHISSVFMTGEWVYKLKKPVDFGFLDFRNLDDRRRFCELEVSLNQRLSQDIYQEVVKIREKQKGQFFLEQNGLVVEYAVKMRQLPDEDNLRTLLGEAKISVMQMRDLGQTLAGFYGRSNRSDEIDHYGSRDVIAYNAEESFQQLEPFVGDLLDGEKWQVVCHVIRSFLESRRYLFDRRIDTGRIRDGHGDLRTDHVYFYRGIQIIDCIEFNDRFRYGDVAVDLAFLHMDIEHLGHSALSRAFLAAYVDAADDPELYSLLDFYAAYRAIVRLKVTCLRSQEVDDRERQSLRKEAKVYMDQAYQYAIQFSRPTVWVFCGLPASGKSFLADNLAKALSIPLFGSDRVRKERQDLPEHEVVPFGQGLYRRGMRDHVYGQLLALAQDEVKKGHSLILDGTYAHRKWRDAVRLLSSDSDTNLIFVECLCKEETIRSRLEQRATEPGLSDARLKHFPQMAKDFEPPTELPPEVHLPINSDQPIRDALAEVLSEGYARKCAQVSKLLQKASP